MYSSFGCRKISFWSVNVFFFLQWECIVWSSFLFNILSFNLILLSFSIQIQFGFQYVCRKDALCYCIFSFIPPFFNWVRSFAFRTQDNCILCSFLTFLQVCLDFFNCRVDNLSCILLLCLFSRLYWNYFFFFHFTVHFFVSFQRIFIYMQRDSEPFWLISTMSWHWSFGELPVELKKVIERMAKTPSPTSITKYHVKVE